MAALPSPEYPYPFANPVAGVMALRRVAAGSPMLRIDANYAQEMSLRHWLLSNKQEQVFAVLPEAAAASIETLQYVVNELLTCWSGIVVDGDARVLLNRLTGERVDVGAAASDARQALLTAARLVQEDLCIMVPSPDGYRLAAAALCFPQHWRLAEKLGASMKRIHEPVDYFQPVLAPVNTFFANLADKPAWRINFQVLEEAGLFTPWKFLPGSYAGLSAATAGEWFHCRFERQSFVRLGGSGAILFLIKSYSHPMRQLPPSLAAEVLAYLEAAPPSHSSHGVLDKGGGALRQFLLQHGQPRRGSWAWPGGVLAAAAGALMGLLLSGPALAMLRK